MSWVNYAPHRCRVPDLTEIEGVDAQAGAVWRCDRMPTFGDSHEGCGKRWVLTKVYSMTAGQLGDAGNWSWVWEEEGGQP